MTLIKSLEKEAWSMMTKGRRDVEMETKQEKLSEVDKLIPTPAPRKVALLSVNSWSCSQLHPSSVEL